MIGTGASPHPWGILAVRRVHGTVVLTVTLGQSELGHERMRTWRATVGAEAGRQRILSTVLVR